MGGCKQKGGLQRSCGACRVGHRPLPGVSSQRMPVEGLKWWLRQLGCGIKQLVTDYIGVRSVLGDKIISLDCLRGNSLLYRADGVGLAGSNFPSAR